MGEILTLTIYFFAGVVQDFFFTLNSKYIAQNKVLPAVIFSFLTVLMNMLVLYNILSELDSQRGLLSIIVYSFGIAFGTYVALNFDMKFKKNKMLIKFLFQTNSSSGKSSQFISNIKSIFKFIY